MKPHCLGILMLLAASGCSKEASFTGGNSQTAAEGTQDAIGGALPTTKTLGSAIAKKCDFTKDFVEVSFPKKIEDCNKAGNIWDFSRSACSSVPKATSFECTFPSFLAAMDKLGTPDERVQQNQQKGAKLVACGEKEGVALAQWYIPTKEQAANGDCSASNANFVTACYTNKNLASGSETAMVADCLK